jgi:hypothetical protein
MFIKITSGRGRIQEKKIGDEIGKVLKGQF